MDKLTTAGNSYYNGFGQLAEWEVRFVFGNLVITEKINRTLVPNPL